MSSFNKIFISAYVVGGGLQFEAYSDSSGRGGDLELPPPWAALVESTWEKKQEGLRSYLADVSSFIFERKATEFVGTEDLEPIFKTVTTFVSDFAPNGEFMRSVRMSAEIKKGRIESFQAMVSHHGVSQISAFGMVLDQFVEALFKRNPYLREMPA